METVFTPWAALGGVLIGLAATLLILFLGRIIGATVILASLLTPSSGSEFSWRGAVLLGIVSGPLALLAITGEMPAVEVPVSAAMLIGGCWLASG